MTAGIDRHSDATSKLPGAGVRRWCTWCCVVLLELHVATGCCLCSVSVSASLSLHPTSPGLLHVGVPVTYTCRAADTVPDMRSVTASG
jgi:hypothetical protein